MGKLPGISSTLTVNTYTLIHYMIISRHRWDTFDIYRLTRIEFSIELFQVKVCQEAMALVVINLVNIPYLMHYHFLHLQQNNLWCVQRGFNSSFYLFTSTYSYW